MNKSSKLFLGIFLRLCISLMLVAASGCGTGKRGKKSRRFNQEENEPDPISMPTRGAKVVAIFPAGAGAMQLPLAVLEQLEQDIGVNKIGSVLELASGVSSGSLTAALITHGSPEPKYSAKDALALIPPLLEDTFKATNDFIKKLDNDYDLKPADLQELFKNITSESSIDMSTSTGSRNAFEKALNTAIGKPKSSLKKKLKDKAVARGRATASAEVIHMMTTYQHSIDAIMNYDRTSRLRANIISKLGNSNFGAPENAKIVAIASNGGSPVFFAPQALKDSIDKPLAVASTPLSIGLMASSAIKGFIDPQSATFIGEGVINNLSDGVGAAKYDASATLIPIMKKHFKGEELLVLVFDNGSKEDENYRKNLPNFRKSDGSSQEVVDDKKVTVIYVKGELLDKNRKNVFDIAGFDARPEMTEFCKDSAKRTFKSKSYKLALKALKAALGK